VGLDICGRAGKGVRNETYHYPKTVNEGLGGKFAYLLEEIVCI